MKNKIVISATFLFILGITSLFFLPAAAENVSRTPRLLPTYFSYSQQELQKLKPLSSTICLTEEDLKKWDRLIAHLFTTQKVPFYDRQRFFTYLYTAQRDAAFISYNVHEHFEGSFDPISFKITQLFFPDFKRPTQYVADPYSEEVANIVLAHFAEKYRKENSFDFQFKIKGNGGYNLSVPPNIANCAKWIPWLVRPVSIYLPPEPPGPQDKEWSKQIQEIKDAQKKLTEEQKQAVYYWAGQAGPGSGDWRTIANQYLFQNNVPLAKALLVRSILMMGLSDVCIAYLNAKYKYSVIRPSTRDRSIEPLIPIPQHPSYPAGHSTESALADAILSYFFPDEKKKWDQLAEQSGTSRIWAGVHYPIDNDEGKKLGARIGEQILIHLREQELQDEKLPTGVCTTPAMVH